MCCGRVAFRLSRAPALIKSSRLLFPAVSSRRVRPGRKCSRRDRFLPLFDDRFHGRLAQPFDCPQAEGQIVPNDAELDVGLVHVGRQDGDSHAAGVVDVLGNAVRTLHPARQERRHELGREVGLEIGRLIGDRAVGGRVRLVEAVAGELFDHAEKFRGLGRLQAGLLGPFEKLLAVFRDRAQFFLADRLDAAVGGRQLDATQAIQNPHHLFLVDHDAVGLQQDLIDDRMHLGDRLDRA